MPVIALTAKAGLSDKVNVLGLGADDYITKPFEKQELLARIQAQLRRAGDYSAVQADASSPSEADLQGAGIISGEPQGTAQRGRNPPSPPMNSFSFSC